MEIRLSPDDEARLTALAAREGRSTDDLVAEALTEWEARHTTRQGPERGETPAEAAARIRALRKGLDLPPGETIRSLIDHGRA